MSLHLSMDGRIPANVATDYRRQVLQYLASDIGQRSLLAAAGSTRQLDSGETVQQTNNHDQLLVNASCQLLEGDLMVVARDMVDLVEMAAESIPLDGITPANLPFERGVALLERPILCRSVEGSIAEEYQANVVAWGAAHDHVMVLIAQDPATANDRFWDRLAPELYPPIGVLATMVIRTDGKRLEAGDRSTRILRWILAMWAISQEPYVSQAQVEPDRATRKRTERAGFQVDAVRVITLRRRAAEATREAMAAKRSLVHRFVVRGHWRRQACGPNRSERKLRWIAPFVKGPDDGEWMSGEKLYRLER